MTFPLTEIWDPIADLYKDLPQVIDIHRRVLFENGLICNQEIVVSPPILTTSLPAKYMLLAHNQIKAHSKTRSS